MPWQLLRREGDRGKEALSAFFSMQPGTERPGWRNKASLDSQSNPLESTEGKNNCDLISIFKIESPKKKKKQLKPLLDSNILVLTCRLLRKIGAKTKQCCIFTLMCIKHLDEVSHFRHLPCGVIATSPRMIFYQLVYFLRDPERIVLSCVSISEGLVEIAAKYSLRFLS